MHLSEWLMHTTVRIESITSTGIVSGTGFFFAFCNDKGTSIPAIVTNKHVIRDSISFEVVFTRMGSNGLPIDSYESLRVNNNANSWIEHPDSSIDLCVLPIGPALNAFESVGKSIFIAPLEASNIPTQKDIESFICIDEITMIGYPNGLWDTRNNLPIVRRGTTATPYRFDYQGKKEFLIDSACYPGSSGSPVFLYNEGSYATTNGVVLGSRFFFLGVMYSGPTTTLQGDVVFGASPKSFTQSMLNLGNVIKSPKLLDFEPTLKSKFP